MSSSSAVHGWLARRPLGSPLAPSRPPSLYKPPSWPRASGRFGAREVLALVLSSGPVDVADPSDTGGLGVLALVARPRLLPFGGLHSRRSASASGAASATAGSKTSECRLRGGAAASGRDESTGYAASVEHSDPSLDGRWSTPALVCGSCSLHASGSWACPAAAAASTAASANPCPARAPSMRCGEHDISCASGRAVCVCGCRTMGRLGGVAKRFEHVWLQVVRQLIMRRNLQCRDGAQSSLLAVTARCDTEDSRSGCGWRASGCQHPPANSRRSVVGQRTRARNGVDQRSLSGSDTVTTAKGNIWGTSRNFSA